MYDFIVQTTFVLSLSILVYMFARALPRLSESAEKPANVFDRVIGKIPLEKVDSAIASFGQRILRRAKILVMKADHLINGYITKIKLHEDSKHKRVDLKERMQALNGTAESDIKKTEN